MPDPSLKQRVRESFDRAAETYDGAAVVQRRVCDRLLEELVGFDAAIPGTILDAGCGTGYGAGILGARWPNAQIVVADFAPAMVRQARRGHTFCCAADIEHLPFRAQAFDVWWSSLTVQWCDLASTFMEAARVLRAGGALAVSTLGPGTFHELRDAFSGVDQYRHTLPFSEPDRIVAVLETTGLQNVMLRRETHTVFYPDLKALLRAVKDIGANNVGDNGRSGMLGRRAWQQVQAAYEQHRTAEGLPASYDVVLVCAEKASN